MGVSLASLSLARSLESILGPANRAHSLTAVSPYFGAWVTDLVL